MNPRYTRAKLIVAVLLFVSFGLLLTNFGDRVSRAQGPQVTVSAADPASTTQGTINLNVKVNGKGFKNGAQAKWTVTGTTDPGGVTVNSTTFVSSTEVTANITVADTAAIANFDIQVTNSDGRGGKGTELFMVVAKTAGNNNNCPTPPAPTSDTKCYAQLPGCLDATFGGLGYVHTNPNQNGGGFSVQSQAVTVQPDGKIVVAADERTVAANRNFAILRYNTDGSLDTSFGDIAPLNPSLRRGYIVMEPSTGYDTTNDILLQPDGKIVFSGVVNTSSGAVVRLNTNGTLDTSFGNGGIVQLGSEDAKKGLALQSDGKIIIGGGTSGGGFSLLRLNPNGSFDASFGSGGKVLANPSGAKRGTSTALSVAIQRVPAVTGEERIVLIGYSRLSSTDNSDWTVMRFRSNGATDTTFGTSGVVKTFFYGFDDQATAVKIDSGNRIVVRGLIRKTSCYVDFAVVRYTQNGSIDGSFSGGTQTVDVYGANDSPAGLEIQSDGKILLFGTSSSGDNTVHHFALVRFNADGSRDSSFGLLGNGVVTTDLFGAGSYGSALALQPDGKIIAVGSTRLTNVSIEELAVARYLP